MRRCAMLLWLVLAGCATDPLEQLETGTPTLSPGQLADLRKRAEPAPAGPTEISAPATVSVPLVKLPTDRPRERGGLYRVPVVLATVNGKAGVRVLLDSGSNRSLFGYSLSRRLAIPIIAGTPPATSLGIGGTVDNYPAIVRNVAIGALQIRQLPALIGPDAQVLNFTRGFWNNPQVMILGVNVLRPLSYLCIDSPGGTVTLSPSEEYRPAAGSKFVTEVPLGWLNDLPAVEIALGGRTFPCVLDTGGDYGLLVPRSRAAELGIWKAGRGPLGASRGVGGAALTTAYEIREAKVGGATFVKVPARTDLVGPEVAGGNILLGNVVLRTCRVTFDFRRGRLWIER